MITITVAELAQRLGCAYAGDGSAVLQGVAPLEVAGPGQLIFVANEKAARAAMASAAGCVIAPPVYPRPEGQSVIWSDQPRNTFAMAVRVFHPVPVYPPGVHPTAVVDASARVAATACIEAHAVVEAGAEIGDHVRIGAGSYVGRDVRLGAGSNLHPRVTVYSGVIVGQRAILHSGCVLGADGFGFANLGDRWEKFPQVGAVILGDDCEIGANACVDRGALGDTVLGNGVKLDNMVHIGHNCRISNHVVIAAQTGLSGGVTVGDFAVIGGQVGIGDKARIESRATLGSGCGVLTSKIVRTGEVVWGTPARPLKQYLEQLAQVSRLGKLASRVAELEGKRQD